MTPTPARPQEAQRYDASVVECTNVARAQRLCNVVQPIPNGRFVLATAYDAVAAERDALRADKERYEWLRERFSGVDFEYEVPEGVATVLTFRIPPSLRVSADLNATIDKARNA